MKQLHELPCSSQVSLGEDFGEPIEREPSPNLILGMNQPPYIDDSFSSSCSFYSTASHLDISDPSADKLDACQLDSSFEGHDFNSSNRSSTPISNYTQPKFHDFSCDEDSFEHESVTYEDDSYESDQSSGYNIPLSRVDKNSFSARYWGYPKYPNSTWEAEAN